jgi:hypothetical protein
MYATFQSEIQKDKEEATVLFDSLENHGFEKASMRNLEGEIVHDAIFPHWQGDYELELIPIHSFGGQKDSLQIDF